jgi:hypothetical protein
MTLDQREPGKIESTTEAGRHREKQESGDGSSHVIARHRRHQDGKALFGIFVFQSVKISLISVISGEVLILPFPCVLCGKSFFVFWFASIRANPR